MFIVDNPAKIIQYMPKEKPTIMVSVPKVWEKIYKTIMNDDMKRNLYKYGGTFANKLIGSALKKKTGGELKIVVSGGGGLPYHIDKFFDDVGIEVLEGYGLTETSPIVAARSKGSRALGTVGKPFPRVQVEIRDEDKVINEPGKEGIIYVKGDYVMKGYYKDLEETALVLQDGWLNTGDIAQYTENMDLQIIGREKEIMVTAGGKNVHPKNIENRLLTNPYILSVMAVCEHYDLETEKNIQWDLPGVLIVPAIDYYNKKKKTNFKDMEELSQDKEAKEFYTKLSRKQANEDSNTKPEEKIRAVSLMPKEFEKGVELSEKLEFKRHKIIREYQADIIRQMYNTFGTKSFK